MKKSSIIILFMLPVTTYGAAPSLYQPLRNLLSVAINEATNSPTDHNGFTPPPHKRRKLEMKDNAEGTPKNKVDRIPELADFIIQKKKEGCAHAEIAEVWNTQYTKEKISAATISRWLNNKRLQPPNKRRKLEVAGNTKSTQKNKVDSIDGLPDFIREKRKKGWSSPKIAREWKKEHSEQTVGEYTINAWINMNKLPLLRRNNNKINKNLEFKSSTMHFITPEVLYALEHQLFWGENS